MSEELSGKTNEISRMETAINEEYSNITGLLILQDNEVLYERYFNGYSREEAVHIASITKSIMSILIGIAIDKGFIESVDEKVIKFFPEYVAKQGEKTLQSITLRNILTMTAPYKYKSEPFTKVYSSQDWTKAALDLLGGRGALGTFKYSTIGIQVLSGLLVNSTGQSVLDFAKDNLFEPLGINAPSVRLIEGKEDYLSFIKDKGPSVWVADPSGVNTAGWGLAINPVDMAKIGQLYLNKGSWEGRQIISSKWIRESTKTHSKWNALAYGYLWWIIEEEDLNGYAALGDGGNVIFISPDKNLLIVIASSFKPRASDRIIFIKEYVLPMIQGG